MKKINKIDLILFGCLMLGCVLVLVKWVTESIVGSEILVLEYPATSLFVIPIWYFAARYCCEVLEQIIEYRKVKKNNREK